MTNQNAETKQELVIIDQQNTLVAFQKPSGLDPVIEQIRKQVKSEIYDISTKEGRDRIGSVARQIGSAKRRLKEMSQGLTADWQAQTKVVTTEASRMEKELDSLRDEIKAPLDEFNEKEKARVEKHESDLDFIRAQAVFEFEPTIEQIEQRLEMVREFNTLDFEEFTDRKDGRIAYSEKILTEKLDLLKKQKAKDEELEKLRKAEEERKQKERDEQLKKEAADNATREAEEKAEAEKVKAQEAADAEKKKIQDEKDEADRKTAQAEAATKAAEEKAEFDRLAAEKQAEKDKEAAIQAEADRQKAQVLALASAAAEREADKQHRAKINNAAKDAIIDLIQTYVPMTVGFHEKIAEDVVRAIACEEIPHVKISY